MNFNPILWSSSLFAQYLQTEDIAVIPKKILDQSGFSGDIAISPLDGSIHVIWIHEYQLQYQVRTRAGVWSEAEHIPNEGIQVHAEEGKKVIKNARKCAGLTVDDNGITHIVFSGYEGRLYYMSGTPGSWSAPFQIAQQGKFCLYPYIVEIDGNLFVCFANADNPDVPGIYTVCRFDDQWGDQEYLSIGDYPSMAKGENGMVYLMFREFEYKDKHNAILAYRVPGFTDWIIRKGVTNADRRAGYGPGMGVGGGYIFVAWNNSTGKVGPEKSELFCARADEPGKFWECRFGRNDKSKPLYYEDTGDPHCRVGVYSDGLPIFLNSRRLKCRYMIWNKLYWANAVQGPWLPGIAQVKSDGQTVWVISSSSSRTDEEVSITGLCHPNAKPFSLDNNAPVITSLPKKAAEIDATWRYDCKANDEDGDSYYFNLTLPYQNMNINSGTGVVKWTPIDKFKGKRVVGVKVTDSKGGYSVQYFNLYVVTKLSAAKFTGNVLSGEAPLEVKFTDQSVGDISSWIWDFGNGETSTLKNPTVTFTQAGEYTVTLIVDGISGPDTLIKENYVAVQNPPVKANFISDVVEGFAPLTVQFTDVSIGEISSWEWDFGDGSLSAVQHPIHTYSTVGLYTVGLKVTSPAGVDSIQNLDYIRVLEHPPVAGFTADPLTGESPLTVQFTDTSSGVIHTWNWDFSDGNNSNEQNPVHVFSDSGKYDITLTVSGPGGSDFVEKQEYIEVKTTPFSVDFSATPLSGEVPLTVEFHDLSTGKAVEWYWYFGDTAVADGGVSIEQNPSYTYAHAGVYSILFTAGNGDTSATVIKHNYIAVLEGTGVAEDLRIPNTFHLCQNYPNPFNATTLIEFALPTDTEIILTIYDMKGQIVKVLDQGMKQSGIYHVSWNGTDNGDHAVPSGLYLLQLEAGYFRDERKMLLLK